MEEMMIGIEGLGDWGINLIISKLEPNDTAVVSCVSKKFKVWASDDVIWASHCSNDLNLKSPLDPFGNTVPSFKVAYQLWREEFSTYPWPLVRRVKKCWDTIETWLSSNFPEVLNTFQGGASEEDLNQLEKALKIKLPLPTRLLYRIHDGQASSDKSLGLIGGYMMYDHLVNVCLLPAERIIKFTKHLTTYFPSASESIYVAASSGNFKVFSLNCENSQLFVGTSNSETEDGMMPCVPDALIKCSGDEESDGLLLWLEEYGRRLQSGLITTHEMGDFTKSICQFPDKPPLCSTSVTNGVKVRASVVFVPELSDRKTPRLLFAYSIRMSLLPEGCTVHGKTFNSCQLHTRHWIIRENETVTADINGEAVIGKYPLLVAGEKEFVYESCSQQTNQGSIEGSFTFVPGRLVSPEGDPFKVEVERFELSLPDYIF